MFSKAKQGQQERQMGSICFSGSELTITKRPCGEMSANELKIESFNLSQYPFLGYSWRKLILTIESTMAKTRSGPAADMEELEISCICAIGNLPFKIMSLSQEHFFVAEAFPCHR